MSSADSKWFASEAEAFQKTPSGLADVFTFIEPISIDTLVEVLNLAEEFPVSAIGGLVTQRSMTLEGGASRSLDTDITAQPPRRAAEQMHPQTAAPADFEIEFERQAARDAKAVLQAERTGQAKKHLWVVLAVVVVAALGFGGWLLFERFGPDTRAADHVDLAKSHAESGDVMAAIIELKNALQKNAQFIDARRLLVHIYIDAGQGGAALKEFDQLRVLGASTDEFEVLRLRAMLLDTQFAEVLAKLEQTKDITRATQLALEGSALLGLGDYRAARRTFRDLESLDPGNIEVALGLARAALALELERYDEAGNDAADLQEILLLKGNIQLARGNADAAEESFEQVLKHAEFEFGGHVGLIRAKLAQGSAAAAEERILAAESIWPKQASAQLAGGVTSDAIKELSSIVELQPAY